MEKEEQIHSVDIGNDGSAFVEVLVGSSAGGATAGEQDYEVSGLGRCGHSMFSSLTPDSLTNCHL